MIVSNQLSRDISLTEARSRLDAACKRLLANKKILAWIMKYCMDEYSDIDLKEIEEQCIEGSSIHLYESAQKQTEYHYGICNLRKTQSGSGL